MLRTVTKRCELNTDDANALNHESGVIYSQTMITHWRAFRHSGHWIMADSAERLNDWNNRPGGKFYDQAAPRPKILQAHCIDAAQQGFYKACKTAKACKKLGLPGVRYPYRRKWYRTTIWKRSGIKQFENYLLLSRAGRLASIRVEYITPKNADGTPAVVREARLVYDRKQKHHFWHLVVDDLLLPVPVVGGITAAIDMGEIHPVAITDGKEVCIVSCRELRSVGRQTCKEQQHISVKLSRCTKGSRRSKRLRIARKDMLARQARRTRNLNHKVSRETVNWSKEKHVGTLAIGDVRDVADKTTRRPKGKKPNRNTRQKLSIWPHGTTRKYLRYKHEDAGIVVDDKVPEHYTSQYCLKCGMLNKCRGRNYRCSNPECRFRFARDGVGSANILSRKVYGELGKVLPTTITYRRPFVRFAKRAA
jgi:putative transposase